MNGKKFLIYGLHKTNFFFNRCCFIIDEMSKEGSRRRREIIPIRLSCIGVLEAIYDF